MCATRVKIIRQTHQKHIVLVWYGWVWMSLDGKNWALQFCIIKQLLSYLFLHMFSSYLGFFFFKIFSFAFFSLKTCYHQLLFCQELIRPVFEKALTYKVGEELQLVSWQISYLPEAANSSVTTTQLIEIKLLAMPYKC